MRAILGVLMGILVLGMGYWAYHENYETRAKLEKVEQVQREIVLLQRQLAVERAEWAWLNRPERLRHLVKVNKTKLELRDMGPEHFGTLDQVIPPTRPVFASGLDTPNSATPEVGDLP
ncbi:MAG: cell division protein FtsL [Pseudomonadota bacterium]